MRILFVLSGNSRREGEAENMPSRPVRNSVYQGESLRENGHEVDFFHIRGRGVRGYLGNIPGIRKQIKSGTYDIIHAHYSLTAFTVTLATWHRMVVSLTGSDVLGMPALLPLVRLLSRYRWSRVIVKTESMRKKIPGAGVIVLPNGVDTGLFCPSDKAEARRRLGLPGKKIILFVADPARKEKNYDLALRAAGMIEGEDVLLLPVFNVAHDQMPYYYNAADVLLITSLWEGSVNAVKEAMACNLPVVSTDVGDVKENTALLEGYHITGYNAAEIAGRLKQVLGGGFNVRARNRIFELGLDADTVARRLAGIYESVISH